MRRIDHSAITRGTDRVKAVSQQDHDSPLTSESSAAVERSSCGRRAIKDGGALTLSCPDAKRRQRRFGIRSERNSQLHQVAEMQDCYARAVAKARKECERGCSLPLNYLARTA